MKMAKASDADLNMAMKLANYLDAIERGQMPDDLSEDSEAIEWLNERDRDQCAKLLDGLRRLLNQGSISRVIWGMAVVCDPANKCLDPDADTIEHHPEIERNAKDAERYHWLRSRVPGGTYRIMGVIYSEGGEGIDAAIDAAMSSNACYPTNVP